MKISKEKREKILEQILSYLFITSPQSKFTSNIAKEIARDEEFIKNLLLDLKHRKLVQEIRKNPQGADYKRRSRWNLTDRAYRAYKSQQ